MTSARILIVEDERIVAKDLTRRLRSVGYDVAGWVVRGEDAVSRAAEEHPDVVLMDIKLSGDMDGIEAAERIRLDHGVPIIYLTAFADDEILERAKVTEPAGYLLKPFSVEELRSAIEMALYKGEMEKRLRESEERYRTLFRETRDPMFIADADCRIVDANPAFAGLLAANPSDLSGAALGDFLHDTAQWGHVLDYMRREGSAQDMEIVIRRKDGVELDCLLTAILRRDAEGRIVQWEGTIRDITQFKKDQELTIQTQRLAALGEMAGSVAHHFNNLLQVVMSSAELGLMSRQGGSAKDVEQNLEDILESARSGAQIVRRLQDFARVRTSDGSAERELLDLSAVARRCLKLLKPLIEAEAAKRGREITLDTHLDEGCYVRGYEKELFDVIMSLLKNAEEALPEGGNISVRTRLEDGNVVLTVRDDGVGIPEEHLPRIFDPFWTTKGYQGTGMGLSVSFGAVRRHGGSIETESRAGEGTAFHVILPFAPKEATPGEAEIAAPARSLSILVVDDDTGCLNVLERALTSRGHSVYARTSGVDAIKAFDRVRPDAVICDLGMPGMNGWETARRLAETARERGIERTPFILLTGWGEQVADEPAAASKYVDAIVGKPVETAPLIRIINRIVDPATNTE